MDNLTDMPDKDDVTQRAQPQRTIDTKRKERIRREYNGRRSNHKGNGQETSQENEELDSTWER